MSNPYLTQLELPSGSTYDLVDAGARDLIAAINNWEYVVCTSVANTPKDVTWDDEGTTITGTLVAASSTMYKIYLVPAEDLANDIYEEYVTVNPSGSTYVWEKFGNTKLPDMSQYVKNASGHSGGTAGELGYKDSASGSTTVAVPKTYTTTTTTATTESKTVTATGTTTGSVSVTKGYSTISPAGSGEATYTPAGSISVNSAGATATINNPTANTVVTDMSVANPSSTEATGELVYCSVSGTKLSLKKFVETTGDSISTTATTVKTGDASYSFSGTGVRLQTDDQVATDASFTGASMTATGSVTVPETFTSSTTTATTEDKTVSITVS